MFRIAICDDQKNICFQIEGILLDYQKQISQKLQIDIFYSGEKLYDFMKKEDDIDLIFLDIELITTDGIIIGKKIREELDNQLTQIVYISGKQDYYKELFDVRPMHFLLKPIETEKVLKDVKLAMKLINKLGNIFRYKKGNTIYKIQIKKILYFESVDRKIKIVHTEGEDYFYGKLYDVSIEVSKYQFMHIHQSYIVHYPHVTKFTYKEVKMSNGTALSISQAKRKEIRELQIKYEKEEE